MLESGGKSAHVVSREPERLSLRSAAWGQLASTLAVVEKGDAGLFCLTRLPGAQVRKKHHVEAFAEGIPPHCPKRTSSLESLRLPQKAQGDGLRSNARSTCLPTSAWCARFAYQRPYQWSALDSGTVLATKITRSRKTFKEKSRFQSITSNDIPKTTGWLRWFARSTSKRAMIPTTTLAISPSGRGGHRQRAARLSFAACWKTEILIQGIR